ncbi:MAG TPA: efflux RND transporter periplasmic adaptor subunit [Terriglobia bacterium]|nr:efflux RND transporter periplasmic adaptor subunit [Terriglobia bacterium]
MSHKNHTFVLAASAVIVATLLLAGCTQHASMDAREVSSPARSSDPNIFEVQNSKQFPTTTPLSRAEPEELMLNGVVAPDVTRTVHVNALAGGRVTDVRTKLGDEVQKGQLLMSIRSTDLAQAIAQYKNDQADELLAQSALKRSQDLYGHGAMAMADLEAAEDTQKKAEVNVQTDADQIRVLGGDLQRLSPIIEVHSPVTGVIVDQQIAGGEVVKSLDSSQSLFMVADLSRVWVLCDVYENDLSKVALGDVVEVRLNAYPDRAFRGTVGNISQVLDPATRTAKVRVELANVGGLFRPQMFATAKFTSRRTYPRLLLPATAILRLHDKDWVFLKVSDRSFRRTEVQGGAVNAQGLQEIMAGLKPADDVVVNALEFSSAVSAD